MSIAEIRDSLRNARRALQDDYLAHPQSARYLRNHAKVVDEHLRLIWRQLKLPADLALIAVGGYGRAELYPRSDIDLLILLPQEADAALQQRLQELVQHLWDIGLEIGHSVRTVAQCIEESDDVTVLTNLLEARLLVGSAGLFRQ